MAHEPVSPLPDPLEEVAAPVAPVVVEAPGLVGDKGSSTTATVVAPARSSRRAPLRSVPAPAPGRPDLDREQRQALHDRVGKGVNPLVYWIVRILFQPFFHAYFRLTRIGREYVPKTGPVILAANHRSFLDPFVIGAMSRRPLYFVAKKELFRRPLQRWFLNSLGAFPIDRGHADGDAMSTARAVLERGDCVVIFPEGTRTRPGGIGTARRGVGRLALETGAPVVPIAVHGTTHIRTRWKIRPHKVTVRAGRPLTFPLVPEPTAELAQAVTTRIWPCVELQWHALGGHTTEHGIGVDPTLLLPELAPSGPDGSGPDDPGDGRLAVWTRRSSTNGSRSSIAPTSGTSTPSPTTGSATTTTRRT